VSILCAFTFGSNLFETFPAPIQLVLLKTFLVTAGVLVAHIIRKTMFSTLDLSNDDNWQQFLMIALFYIVVVYAFAMGG